MGREFQLEKCETRDQVKKQFERMMECLSHAESHAEILSILTMIHIQTIRSYFSGGVALEKIVSSSVMVSGKAD